MVASKRGEFALGGRRPARRSPPPWPAPGALTAGADRLRRAITPAALVAAAVMVEA
ncbi:hypothetical protein [Candidatus Frankia alpina]|uniref:hypothetical protein n=1 Tax=Candidatus Frankia alpina TaxID=2699483 RepID=UPI001386A332|nr:hypothetical protein [Candidatus Frankia alpina]